MRTVQRHITSTYFVPIGCRHSELGRVVRKLQLDGIRNRSVVIYDFM